jgi:hypothetical protein
MVATAVVAANGQIVPITCPSLYIDAPQSSLSDGVPAIFTVRMEPKLPDWKLKYQWVISSGRVISGEGTDSILVERKLHYVNALVNVGGFPHDDTCPRVVSERAFWNVQPVAEKIKAFQGPKWEPSPYQLGPLVDLGGAASDYFIVFMGFKQGTSEETVLARENQVLKAIGDRLERDRFEMIRVFEGTEVTEFWRIPLGAKNPTCEVCGKAGKSEKR